MLGQYKGDRMGKGKYLEARVKRLLSENKTYQKSDLALISRIWFEDLKRIKYDNVNGTGAIEFLQLLREGSLTSHESVTRCRRKLQAQYPELRDESVYKGRAKVQKQMKEEGTYW
mgnify:CR=1 FL=1|jgi:hypothetical protein|tara:strand:- start:1041 stop:1385 length:345 start_codon:yes stop_codon:yes gene_type:complete